MRLFRTYRAPTEHRPAANEPVFAPPPRPDYAAGSLGTAKAGQYRKQCRRVG